MVVCVRGWLCLRLVHCGQGTRVQLEPANPQGDMERASAGLTQPSNRTCSVDFQQFHVIFPHGYNFAECYEEVSDLTRL